MGSVPAIYRLVEQGSIRHRLVLEQRSIRRRLVVEQIVPTVSLFSVKRVWCIASLPCRLVASLPRRLDVLSVNTVPAIWRLVASMCCCLRTAYQRYGASSPRRLVASMCCCLRTTYSAMS